MPYTINKFSGEPLVVLEDGTIDTSTSLGLVGRNYVGYGETQNENFVFLLENFANEAPPSRPLTGQTWFNSATSTLYVWDGAKWTIVGSAVLSETPPEDPNTGLLWLRTVENTLNIWNGTGWSFIGPEAADGFGITRARSTVLLDGDSNPHAVILLTIDDTIIGICSKDAFTINPVPGILGFSNLVVGITLNSSTTMKGNLIGNASSATKLETTRTINGVGFDGQNNITIQANTAFSLTRGAYITGTNFNGSVATTWEVDASSANLSNKIVARNAFGGFSAGIITATLAGQVNAPSGTSTFDTVQANEFIGATLSGNASTATKLATARTINGTAFDGSANVTVTANAETLTGSYLKQTVLDSKLRSVGTLEDLSVANDGITIGSNADLALYAGTNIGIQSKGTLNVLINDAAQTGGTANIKFMSAAQSLGLGGDDTATLTGYSSTNINLGHTTKPWNKIYATTLVGNANTATLATTATNIAGGGAGAIPYQTASGTTAMLPVGAEGYVLRAGANNSLVWSVLAVERLTKGTYITLAGPGSPSYYNTQVPLTIDVDASTTNTASKIVARDSSGNFAAGTITATLNGNAATATALQTARTINGVSFDGTANITVPAIDETKVAIAGSTMTGYLTLSGTPTLAMHATNKAYVDTRIPVYTFTAGAQYSTSGYTNQVGSFNNGANFFDVFPPSGKTMANIVAFIPSIHVIHFAGGVDGNDSFRCTYSYLGDRIRVYVQNTEQRSTPAANYLAIWS